MKLRILLPMALVGVLLFLLLFWPLHTVITVEPAQMNRPVLCLPAESHEEFTISFVHSVNKRPVYDTIRFENDHFLVVKSRYDSFGAGMPVASDGEARLQTVADGWLELTGINLRLADFTIFVGTVANHSLHYRGQVIPLTTAAPSGTALKFRPDKISAIDYLRGRCAW